MVYLKKGLQGIFALLIGGFSASIIAYFTRIILARTLSPAEYGLFYAVFSFFMFVILFSNLGMGATSARYIARYAARGEQDNVQFTILFTLFFRLISTGLFAVGIFLFRDFLASEYFTDANILPADTAYLLFIFLGIFILLMLTKIQRNTLQGFQRQGSLSISRFFEKVFFFVGVCYLAYTGTMSVITVAWAFLLNMILTVGLLIPLFIRSTKFSTAHLTWKPKIAKTVTLFSFAAIFAAAGNLTLGYADTLILTYYASLEEVGIYNVVLPTILGLGVLSKAIQTAFMPLVSELWAKGLKDKVAEGVHLVTKYFLFLITPLMVVLLLFPKFFLRIIFGEAYVGGAVALQILTLGLIFINLVTVNESVLFGLGVPRKLSEILFIATFVNLVLNFILIPQTAWYGGINGAAIATTISYVLLTYLTFRILGQKMTLISERKTVLVCIIGGILLALIIKTTEKLLHINQYAEVTLAIIVGGIIYVLFCLSQKVITKKELLFFAKKLIGR